MRKQAFQDGWICYPAGNRGAAQNVALPHDAMMLDQRKAGCEGGEHNGWVDARDYVYEKEFFVPGQWWELCPVLEFEGVYQGAEVFINGKKAAFHEYGYTGFYVELKDYLSYGERNKIRVTAANKRQPNCRWYSGTGIYRPVWLYLLHEDHILLDGVKITTLDYKKPAVRVTVETTGKGPVAVELTDRGRVLCAVTGNEADAGGCGAEYSFDITLPDGVCWDMDHPFLYTCRVTFKEDVVEETFGIRQITCNSRDGFLINGKRVILRGACIHHDNGILGACAWNFAERRKIRLLKEAGYNAVRSAHNPCSKSLLRACDELGMLVMDEYVDEWFIHKTRFDYAGRVESCYKEDLTSMVNKDFNHPSVVMYSTGNEVSETASKRGVKLCGEMTQWLHQLDPSRPVTCGVNLFFNFLSTMGFGVYSDKKAERQIQSKNPGTARKKAVGSEFFNKMAGVMGAEFMKTGATFFPCDRLTKDAFAAMDVAGYNYGIKRYLHDLEKYPDRLIVGSETFCFDAYRFFEMAKKNQRLIGDFVWSGMDYLGEVGVGSWEYREYAPEFSHGPGWVSAGSGRLDLTGKALSEMKYTQVAFELEPIGMGVVPVPFASEKHSPSAWKMTSAVESWSWHGCDGMKTRVEVYARAHHVSLFVNGTCVGTKKPAKDCRVVFQAVYHDGTVKAEAYDQQNRLLAQAVLETAGENTILTLEPEDRTVRRSGGLCYVRLKYTDEKGVVKPMERGEITVYVEGGRLLGLGSACPYTKKSYLGNVTDTYYGEALAVILPDQNQNSVPVVTVTAESRYGRASAKIEVVSDEG